MNQRQKLQLRTQRRLQRVRGKLHGTAQRPRLSVFRSNQHMSLQAINDDAQVTLLALSDQKLDAKGTKTERATALAKAFGEQLKTAGVTAAVFDRGFYRYHGRVQAVADALRSTGLSM
jgi:large subunit ribosomal protein L18